MAFWRTSCLLASILLLGHPWPARAQLFNSRATARAQTPDPPAAKSRPWRIRPHFTFHNIDAARLLARLQRFGFRLPIPVTGKVTARISVSVPMREFFHAKDYLISAVIDSGQLIVDNQDLRAVHAQLTFVGGVLELKDFRFELPPQDNNPAPPGKIAGSGRMQVVPRGDLHLGMQMQGVLVDRLASQIAMLRGISGRIDGQVSAAVAVNSLKDLNAWRVAGSGRVSQLALPGAPSIDGQAAFRVEQGTLQISQLRASAQNATVTGSVQVQAAGGHDFQIALTLAVPQLEPWHPWLAKFVSLPWTLKGQARAAARASGALVPFSLRSAAATFELGNLSLGPLVAQRVRGDMDSDGRNVGLRNLQISAYGGTISGAATAPLALNGPLNLEFAWSAVQLGALGQAVQLAALGQMPVPISGTAAGRLRASGPIERLHDVAAWSAVGSVVLQSLRAYGSTSNQMTASFRLAQNRLEVENVTGDWDQGRVSGSASLELAAPYHATAKMELVNGDLAPFNALPGRLHPPLPVSGRYSVRLGLQGTIKPLAAQATGGFLAQSARIGPAAIDRVSFVFRGTQDWVRVDDFQAALLGGQAAGNAMLPISPQGPAGEASVRWRALELGPMAQLVPRVQLAARGNTSGRMQLKVPAGGLLNWADWTADGQAHAAGLALGGFDLGQAAAEFALRDRKLHASKLELSGPMGTIDARADAGLSEPFDYAAHLKVERANLAVAAAVPALAAMLHDSVSGQLAATADVQGTLQPLTANGSANITATNVVADRLKIDQARAEARFDRRSVELTTAEATLYGGTATASGTLSLDGPSRLEAALKGVNLASVAAALGYSPEHLAAVAEGGLSLNVSAGQVEHPEAWQMHGSLDLPRIMAGQQQLGTLRLVADYGGGMLKYQADGELLGGKASAQGELKPPVGKQPFSLGSGHIELLDARLGQLATLANRPAWSPLSGWFSTRAEFHPPKPGTAGHEPAPAIVGGGSWSLADVRWKDRLLVRRLGGAIRITPQRLDLVDTQGNLAGGTLLAAGSYNIAQPLASSFSLQLIDAQLGQLSALAGQNVAARGTLDLTLRGNLAMPWMIYGNAAINDAQLAGVRIGDGRMSLAAEVDPLTATGQFQVSQAAASIAGGRATGKLKADFRGQLAVDASANFNNVDLRSLSGQLSSLGRMVNGRASGSVTASGQNVRSVDDLSGSVRIRLTQTQAMSLPVLDQVGPFLSLGVSGATTFNDGRLNGSFSRGVLRVQSFTLTSTSLKIFAEGTITRKLLLNLNVTAKTSAENGLIASALAAALPIAGPTPIGLLIEANELLANQTINLLVRGTATHPSISVRPAPLLAEEAVRFLLLQTPGASALAP